MPTTPHVHRSYRIEQETQYIFEAFCHTEGQTPSQVLGQLIRGYNAAHYGLGDKQLTDAVEAIVARRVAQTMMLTNKTDTVASE